MQTDPNPANYLYDIKRNRLNLIDFGSGRDFDKRFIDGYMQMVWGAFNEDREQTMHHSKQIGYITGEENRILLNAHYETTLSVTKPYRYKDNELFDFSEMSVS